MGSKGISFFCFCLNKDTEDCFIIQWCVGYSLQQGYEGHRHAKAFEQIGSAAIPPLGHPIYNASCVTYFSKVINYVNINLTQHAL